MSNRPPTLSPTPDRALAHVAELSMSGRHQAALDALKLLMRQRPKDAQVARWMACELGYLEQLDQAIYHAQRALMLEPGQPEASLTLAYVLIRKDRVDDAVKALDEAAKLHPDHEELQLTPLSFLSGAGRRADVLARTAAHIERGYENPEVWIFRGVALHEAGQVEESLDVFREGIRRFPDYLRLRMICAFSAQYSDAIAPRELHELHLDAGRVIRRLGPPEFTAFANDRTPDRPLRVGFVCADFRRHVSAYFLAPVLRGLPRGRITPMVYHASVIEDDFSAIFKQIVSDRGGAFRMVDGMSDDRLIELMRGDQLDVLVECSGFINLTRVPALGMRAAPVQCSWMAYPTGTGIDTIDYRITDAIVDPPSSLPDMPGAFGERLLRVEGCELGFDPLEPIPEPEPPPSVANGFITFGCFNAVKKVTPTTIRLWSALMAAVPGSRLRMRSRGMEEPEVREMWWSRFAEGGIAKERVDLLPPLNGAKELIPDYRHVDIALDPYPYHGTTTTCESLAMGVAVLTLMGDRPAARVGGSLLKAVGLRELAVDSQEEFVRVGKALAADGDRLARLRKELPTRVRERLGNDADFGARFERAIREGWRAWCAGTGRPA